MEYSHIKSHSKTPKLTVVEPRRHAVRTVEYLKVEETSSMKSYSHVSRYDEVGRCISQWDPRLFSQVLIGGECLENQKFIYSLRGTVLNSDSVDAGWRLSLFGEGGEVVKGWDARGREFSIEYDGQLRMVALFEEGGHRSPVCIQRCNYATSSSELAMNNLCGELVRCDDSAGCQLIDSLSLRSQVMRETRHFLKALDEPDWPISIELRDKLLEFGGGAESANEYNALGELTAKRDAKDHQQLFDYTCFGKIRRVCLKLKHWTAPVVVIGSVVYDAVGAVTSQVMGNGIVLLRQYAEHDSRLEASQVRQRDGSCIYHWRYRHDPVGNIVAVTDLAKSKRFFANQGLEPECAYRYDSLYRLIEATGIELGGISRGPGLPEFISPPDPARMRMYKQSYRYDEAGNLQEVKHQGSNERRQNRLIVTSRLSNRSVEQINGFPPDEEQIAAAFDSNGNCLYTIPGQTLIWNARNQLKKVCQVLRDSGLNDEETYIYGAEGERVRKVCFRQVNRKIKSSEVRYFPGLEVRLNEHVGANELNVVIVNSDLCDIRILHEVGGRSRRSTNDRFRYGVRDHLGSLVAELDGHASIVSEEYYYPYGGTSWWAGRSLVEASYKTTRYNGKECDATQFYCHGIRYYLPWLARWINPDPGGAVDALNLYQASSNNPITYRDFTGGESLLYSDAIQSVADNYRVVIGLRAPNPLGAGLLVEGYPTKNFHVKAKSSSVGPTAGFIPLNPFYSKVASAQLSKQQKSIDSALASGSNAVPLTLSEEREKQLLANGSLVSSGGGYQAVYPSGQVGNFTVNAKREVFDQQGAVKVLTNPRGREAITADYDLFAIYPRVNQANNIRPLQSAPVFIRKVSSELETRSAHLRAKKESYVGAQEDPEMGNIHHFGKVIVSALNTAVNQAGYQGGQLFWHNDETGNPFSPGFDPMDKPIFFVPGASNPVQVSGRAELLGFQRHMRGAGFGVEYSPVFGF